MSEQKIDSYLGLMWQSLSEPGLLPDTHTLLLWGTSVSCLSLAHVHPTHIVKVHTGNYIKPAHLSGSDDQCPSLSSTHRKVYLPNLIHTLITQV